MVNENGLTEQTPMKKGNLPQHERKGANQTPPSPGKEKASKGGKSFKIS